MTCIHALPRTLRLRTSPPYQGGLRRCHMSSGSGPHLPTEVGSGAVMCPMALDLTSRLRWVPPSPRALWLWIPPLYRGGFWCCHVSHGSQLVVGLKYKKGLAGLPMQLSSRVSKTRTYVSKVPDARAIMGL
jgi:hypothetical protein